MKLKVFSSIIFGLSIHAQASQLTPLESLGERLFFEVNLSKNRTQSCSTCHNPATGFADPRPNASGLAGSLGDDGTSIGGRNTPTAAYAKFSPDFYQDKKTGEYFGGQFLDGRARHLMQQAGQPLLNPIEMGMKNQQEVLERILESRYYVKAFRDLFGPMIFQDPQQAYGKLTEALAAFEKTTTFATFDSKYDRYLKGTYKLTDLEDLGRSLFFSNNNTNCSTCHMLRGEDQAGETFTNYAYHNIGVPPNQVLVAAAGLKAKDKGLLENPLVKEDRHRGKFKVPTLRNVAVTAPYMHNGVFKKLATVIEFYDHFNNETRKINPETGKKWETGEFMETLSRKELNAKVLSKRKVEALVAFLAALTDQRYEPLLTKSAPNNGVR